MHYRHWQKNYPSAANPLMGTDCSIERGEEDREQSNPVIELLHRGLKNQMK